MTAIDDFLAQKKLAANSLSAYRYDLEQFRELIQGEIEPAQLASYQHFLTGLKPAVQRRKLSAVNQFLYYLYQQGQVKTYHKLQLQLRPQLSVSSSRKLLDLSVFWKPSDQPIGQTIALLIWQLGLQPSEILTLTADDLNLEFKVLTITKGTAKRILKLDESLLPYLSSLEGSDYLFARASKPYSRQWLFNQLRSFLTSIGFKELSAQKLREQYILSALENGKSLSEIAKSLGLKSLSSLVKYQI